RQDFFALSESKVPCKACFLRCAQEIFSWCLAAFSARISRVCGALCLIVGNYHQIAVLAFHHQVDVVRARNIVGVTVTDANVASLMFSNLYASPVSIDS